MNTNHYEAIFEQLKLYYPYLVDVLDDWGPQGKMDIWVKTNDGKRYIFYGRTSMVRRVADRPVFRDDLAEEEWRYVFADRLAEYMNTRGITQRGLSEYTGLSKGTISNYIKGKATPSAYALTKLARAFDCTVMELLE